jgi:hypothetical protein
MHNLAGYATSRLSDLRNDVIKKLNELSHIEWINSDWLKCEIPTDPDI